MISRRCLERASRRAPGILLKDQNSKGVLETARHLSKCPFSAGAFYVDDVQNAANLPRVARTACRRQKGF